MFDHFITVATITAVTLQVTVGIIFFGALTTMTLIGFAVIPGPY